MDLVKIYIADKTYDNFDGEEEENSRNYKKRIEQEHDIKLTAANIGAGADFPAFLWAVALAPFAIFFLGKKINENLDAWVEIGKKIEEMLNKKELICFNKAGAAIWALYQSKLYTKNPKLLAYKKFDSRFEKQYQISEWLIEPDVTEELTSNTAHVFLIEIENKNIVKIIVHGSKTEIIEIKNDMVS